jgi:hypothetical protein
MLLRNKKYYTYTNTFNNQKRLKSKHQIRTTSDETTSFYLYELLLLSICSFLIFELLNRFVSFTIVDIF